MAKFNISLSARFSEPPKRGCYLNGEKSSNSPQCEVEDCPEKEVEDCPEREASFPQRLFHTWILPLLWRGFRSSCCNIKVKSESIVCFPGLLSPWVIFGNYPKSWGQVQYWQTLSQNGRKWRETMMMVKNRREISPDQECRCFQPSQKPLPVNFFWSPFLNF